MPWSIERILAFALQALSSHQYQVAHKPCPVTGQSRRHIPTCPRTSSDLPAEWRVDELLES
jgi:hypothetical protein